MRKIVLFYLSLHVISYVNAQSLHRPIAAVYTGLGAYSLHHLDAFSYSSNQASLAQLKETEMGVYGEQRFLLAATNMFSAMVGIPGANGNFGIQANYFGFTNYNESQLGLMYARKLGSKLDLGTQFNYYSSRIPGYPNSNAFTVEIGMIVHISEKVHAGIHCYNPIGGYLSHTNKERLSAVFKTGLGYEMSDNLFLSTEIVKIENLPVNVNAGIQYNFEKIFFARMGVATITESPYAGAGIYWNQMRIDLSASIHPQLGISPGLMFIVNPKAKTSKNEGGL